MRILTPFPRPSVHGGENDVKGSNWPRNAPHRPEAGRVIPEPAFIALAGGENLYGRALGLAVPHLVSGRPIVLVDGANAFDPYVLTDAARRLGADPAVPLSRLFVSRAFTCHQLTALIEEKLLPALQRYRAKTVVVMGLLETLYDEEVPAREARRLLQRMLRGLRRTQREGASVMVLCRRPSHPVGERRWWPLVRRAVDHTRHLPDREDVGRLVGGGGRFSKGPPSLLPLFHEVSHGKNRSVVHAGRSSGKG